MGKDQHLLDAARCGDIKAVGKLIERTAKRHGPLSSFRRSLSIDCQDVNGYTSLHHACLNGHSSIVRLLLAHNARVDVPDIRGSTPLFLAAWAGHQDIVKMLLMHSPNPANPNAQTIENETPLHSGAQHGHNVVVAILLSYDADPTIRNNSFQTALDLAAQFGRLQAVQVLLRVHPDLIAPYLRYEAGDNQSLASYSTPFANSPTKHIFTHTCLHLASRNGHKKVVETLLLAGVDVNILTHSGSALHEAALCGKKSVVVTLLKAGIDVHATDGNGRTALDILADYPPHVTYDIVVAINEFTKLADMGIKNGAPLLPKRLFEKNGQRQKHAKSNDLPKLKKKQADQTGLSHSLSSLDKYATVPANYLVMKPIKLQKSVNDVGSLDDNGSSDDPWQSYTPVYKLPHTGALMRQQFTSSNLSGSSVPSRSIEYINMLKTGSGSEDNSCVRRFHHADQYVEMSVPSPKIALNAASFGVDNNNNSHKEVRSKMHSPTPDYPPPTVSEAEHAILNYMKPLAELMNSSEATTDSLRTTCSFSSDNVEEFIADMPFAGLLKGSTLNLAQDELDGREALRSPSMVRSVNTSANHRHSLSRQRYSTTGEDFSASRVWAEIDTIFEHIGNEVSTVEQDEEAPNRQPVDDARHSLYIRKPAELLLGEAQSAASQWCHSPYTLIYGEIRYTVFYLGSTVIRQLQGTISTRKSIQKLKIDESLQPKASVSDFNLLENCNTSTKYLKAANSQTRLKVDIAVSCVGVKFIDYERKTAICSHDIENINCVCQDVEDMRYFAYITKEQELHYCHVFMVDNLELAKEIILTLGQAFEVAYQLALSASLEEEYKYCTPNIS